MLIRFNIKNFLSFSAREDQKAQEFSMIAGKVRHKKEHIFDDGKIKLLKFAAVYGANASGKSNLVKAMDFMQEVIVLGLPEGHTDKYCKVDADNKHTESYFELEISLNGSYYSYGFEVILSQSKFVSEWLIELNPEGVDKVLFNRDILNGEYKFGGKLKDKGLNEKLNVYAGDIKSDSSVLLLSIMNQNKKNLYQDFKSASILKDVFYWIKKSFAIHYPNQPISDYSYLSKSDKVEDICKIISAFGTGITNFEMVEVPIEKVLSRLPKNLQNNILSEIEQNLAKINDKNKELLSMQMMMRSNQDFFVIKINKNGEIECKTIEFCHGKKEVLFNLSEESDGTIRILDLLEILLSDNGKTYVIDELDRCLHPSMSYKFIETFLKIAEEKNIQLIVTTHESRLMDFDLLRRDEIWFVNKKKTGESDIYSLEEYNARFDQKIDKAYLEGRYGGVPIFSTVFPVNEG